MAIPKMLSTRQASEATGFSVQKIIRLIEAGRLPAVNTSTKGRPTWSIREVDLEAFFQPTNITQENRLRSQRRRQRLDANVAKVV